MKLRGDQIEVLQEAILQAFDFSDLRQIVRATFEEDLEDITMPEDAEQGVFELIETAEQRGWTEKLLKSLAAKRPDNVSFQNAIRDILQDVSVLPSNDSESQSDDSRPRRSQVWIKKTIDSVPAAAAGAGLLAFVTFADNLFELVENVAFGKSQRCVGHLSEYVRQIKEDTGDLDLPTLSARKSNAENALNDALQCHAPDSNEPAFKSLKTYILTLEHWQTGRTVQIDARIFIDQYFAHKNFQEADIQATLEQTNSLVHRVEALKAVDQAVYYAVKQSVHGHLIRISSELTEKRDAASSPATKGDSLVSDSFEALIDDDGELNSGVFSQRDLATALSVAENVGRLFVKSPDGSYASSATAFRVSERLILTTGYALNPSEVERGVFALPRYVDGALDKKLIYANFPLDAESCFVHSRSPDFSLVAVNLKSEDGWDLPPSEPIQLQKQLIQTNDASTSVIHFGTSGAVQEKIEPQVSIRDGNILEVTENYVRYTNPTGGGSGGAPVFGANWKAIAVHSGRVPRQNENGEIILMDGSVWSGDEDDFDQIVFIAKEGVRTDRIVEWLQMRSVEERDFVTSCDGIEQIIENESETY